MALAFPPKDERSLLKVESLGRFSAVAAAPSILEQPLAWAARSLGLPASAGAWRDLGIQAGLLAGFLGLALIVVARPRSRAVYVVCTAVIILAMVFVPLRQSQQVLAFGERMAAQQQEQQAPRPGMGRPGQGEGTGELHTDAEEWGNLPPAIRDQLLQTQGEGFPLKYRELLRRYYRELAKPRD